MDTKKTFYITTPIYYTNNSPHVGHAYASTVADILARYHREIGNDTFFLTGTADHGDKIRRAAEAANMNPQAFTDINSNKFKDLYEKLNISYDDFIRNSDKEKHWPGAQALWRAMERSEDIYWKAYEGLYCVGCEKFITEKDLVDGKCPDHDKVPEIVKEENYFFKLSKYAEKVRALIEKDEIRILPASRKAELLAFIDSGLKDVSFSRPENAILWGIPVPEDEHDQMMYVWCEELSNYISALGYGKKDHNLFDTYWPTDLHVVGKDILRFHAIVWPAMLLSAGLPLPKTILAHGMIISGGKKMSKTIGNVIDPNEYIDLYGADAFRYYLAREISPFEDGDFSEEKFIETYNANLANGLGNLVSRVFKMAQQYFDGEVTRKLSVDVPLQVHRETFTGGEDIEGYSIPYMVENIIIPEYKEKMDTMNIQQAADVVWKLIGILDGYITHYEPFKLIKEDKEKTENILWNLLFGIETVAKLIKPILPETAEKIEEELKQNSKDLFEVGSLEMPLFARIDTNKK
ncbi:MAG: methionine--tRNA ligase [Candidatus Pacebacteria bacterium]|nr:methionine--tRNA ligase [Candidatus Paceibacterota bacterium]